MGLDPHFYSDPSRDLRKSVEKCFIYRGSHACILKLFTAHQQRKIVQTPTFIGLATPLNITIMWAQSSVFTSCVDNFTYVNLRFGQIQIFWFTSDRCNFVIKHW